MINHHLPMGQFFIVNWSEGRILMEYVGPAHHATTNQHVGVQAVTHRHMEK